MSALAEIASNRVGEPTEKSPLGGPAVGMVVIVPAGLPQESPGRGANRVKERVVYCCGEKLIQNNVQNNYLKV
jgi:hypothetical protein